MKRVMMVLIGLSLSLFGCSGNGIAECEYEESAVAWDEEADNGVVPEDLLAFAETTATSTSAEGPNGDAEIEIGIARSGSSAFYMEGRCEDRLEIPLTVSVATTGDDALQEEMEIRAIEENGSLTVLHYFDREDLSGTFTPTVEEGAELYRLELNATIAPSGSGTGEIISYTETVTEGGDLADNQPQVEWNWEW